MTKTISKAKAVEIINSIKTRYPELRQKSKAISFASLYGGTHKTLMANCGLSEVAAKEVEANYHEMYKVSDAWKASKLQAASTDGFVTVAFGLRVRTPLLKQVVWGSNSIPNEAAAEGRTAGNALGQSFGLLNCRAANEFMQKVWDSPYRLDIKLIAQIHDAIYILVRDDPRVMTWVNQELTKSMAWQELPEITHTQIKLSAATDIFWPDWSHPITLPDTATQAEIIEICAVAKQKYLKETT